MTISEKLVRAKDDYDDVYKSARSTGYDIGHQDGTTEGMAVGKQDEREKFWSRYLHGGQRQVAWGAQTGLFNGRNFGFDNFYPAYDIKPVGDASHLFYNWSEEYGDGSGSLKKRLEECGVVLDTSEATKLTLAFAYSYITEIPALDCRGLGNGTSGLFRECYQRLQTIEKIIVNADVTFSSWFRSANVRDVRFEGEIGQDLDISYRHYASDQSVLSAESIRNIIEHLSDEAEGKTLTLSATAVENAFTETEWDALESTKTNWTISLV